jgi:KaiC/GvpD/RAD55 family RecA-like ATPase
VSKLSGETQITDKSVSKDIIDTLSFLGFRFKTDSTNNNIILSVCPFCFDSNDHFYIGIGRDNLGLWNCFKCNGASVGNRPKIWSVLKAHLLGTSHDLVFSVKEKTKPKSFAHLMAEVNTFNKEIFGNSKALSYLVERGLSVDSIAKYKLGYTRKPDKDGNEIEYISIPYFSNHELVNIKFRTLPPAPKRFIRLPGGQSILYNFDNVDLSKNYIYICEGELDAISLAQRGETNIVSLTAGAKSFLPDWFDQLRIFKIIYLVMDNDRVGQEGAEIIADRLGRDRCYNVLLPCDHGIKDLNDFFLHYDLDDFDSYVRKATQFTIRNIYTVEAALSRLERTYKESGKAISGLDTPWPSVNTKLGVIARGDLVYLTARAKTGKTTFALNLCYYYAWEKGIPSLLFCLEMPPERLAYKLACLHRKMPSDLLRLDDLLMTRVQFTDKDVPLYFGYTTDRTILDKDGIFKVLDTARRKYGLEFIVFDNLQYLARSITHTTQEVAAISREFKLFALNGNIYMMVIAQPKRFHESVMTSEHIKDSSAPEADADSIIILNRKSVISDKVMDTTNLEDDSVLSPIVRLSVDKSRYSCGGVATLYFDGAMSLYREATLEELGAL